MSILPDWLFSGATVRWLQETIGLGYPLPFEIFSLLGDTWGVLLVLGVALWLFGRRAAYPVVGIIVVGAVTKLAMTWIFSQERPDGPGIVVYQELEIGSFPSGHVYATVGPWGLLFALGLIPFRVVALMTVLVSLGRLYLGTHYIGDVLGGIFFGALLVWGFWWLWQRIEGWLGARGQRFWTGVAAVAIVGTLLAMTGAADHPRRFEIFGMVIGGAIGLVAESRWVRWEPRSASGRWKAAVLALGTLGIALMVWLDRSQSPEALVLGTVTAGLAALWTVLAMPALLARWGGRTAEMEGRGGRADGDSSRREGRPV